MKKTLVIFSFIIFFLAFSVALILNLFPIKYKKLIKAKSIEFDIDSGFIASVIFAESRFNKNAKSNKGAVGLMQLMPQTAKSFYVGNSDFNEAMLFDPEVNVDIGCRYLKYLFDKYNDELTVLACYNAGEKVVLLWKGSDKVLLKSQIKYKETLNYVEKVQKMKKYYKIFMK